MLIARIEKPRFQLARRMKVEPDNPFSSPASTDAPISTSQPKEYDGQDMFWPIYWIGVALCFPLVLVFLVLVFLT